MTTPRTTKGKARRGLAPLEFVIALPLLLGLMALMVNVGTLAGWKVRGQGVARHTVWATRWPRTLDNTPAIFYWEPFGGTHGRGRAADATALNGALTGSVALALRGPQMYSVSVNPYLLDANRGLHVGRSGLARGFPMLGNQLGRFGLRAHNVVLDDLWQFGQMPPRYDWRTPGLSQNADLRMPIHYESAQGGALVPFYTFQAVSNTQTAERYSVAYVNAIVGILGMLDDLAPLDNDDEFITYGHPAPDFHPRLPSQCNTTRLLYPCFCDESDAEPAVESLVDDDYGAIPNLPRRMTQSFINLYQQVIQNLQDQMQADPTQNFQSEIAQLQQKVDTLNDFLGTL